MSGSNFNDTDNPAISETTEANADVNVSTGILDSCDVTADVGNLTFSVTAGTVRIANFADPLNPDGKLVAFAGSVNVTPSISDGEILVTIDESGSLGQIDSILLTIENLASLAIVATIQIRAGTIIDIIDEPLNQGYANSLFLSIYHREVLGPGKFNSTIGANGANLKFDVSSGYFLSEGVSFRESVAVPYKSTITAVAGPSFFRSYLSSGGRLAEDTSSKVTDINPLVYNDTDTGTLVSVPANNNATIIRVYAEGENKFITAYGQAVFDNLDDAEEAAKAGADQFLESRDLFRDAFLGYICVRKAATDLSNASDARFVQSNVIRLAGGSSGVPITGVETFTELSDTPADYSGSGGYLVKVNTGATGLEFVADGGAATFDALTDTPASKVGNALKFPRVNAGETALEYVDAPAPSFRGGLMYRSADFLINDATNTFVLYNVEAYDTDGFLNIPPAQTRITIPANVNRVRLFARIQWAVNDKNTRRMEIIKNGTTGLGSLGNPAISQAAHAGVVDMSFNSGVVDVSQGDYFEVQVYQDSEEGVNLLAPTGEYCCFGVHVID